MVNLNNITRKQYYHMLWGTASILLGTYFLVEHIWTWGQVEITDFIGHEYLGFALIVLGILLNVKLLKGGKS